MKFVLEITAESEGEKKSKIGQHLPTLWAIKYRVVFLKHGVDFDGNPNQVTLGLE